ncbi:MAG: hypothetical protein MJZ75_06485 [Paludibacteraceae bacterium]|nr:hypothetical protein [Paludibacteraceae bacterium]
MKHQTYLCVDLRTLTQDTPLQVGEGRKGMLTMTEDGERFEFEEGIHIAYPRNLKVYKGSKINISRTLDGHYMVNLRHLELTSDLNPKALGKLIAQELTEAKKELGL